jgi:hypothetical protein
VTGIFANVEILVIEVNPVFDAKKSLIKNKENNFLSAKNIVQCGSGLVLINESIYFKAKNF